MKKSLSLLLAIALVFGLFSAAASAATPSTPAEAGAVLKDLGVLKGDGNDLLENDAWKRQDIVVLLARLLAKEDVAAETAKSHTFADVPKGYYDGFLSWAKAEGYVNGHSDTKFGFNEELTVAHFSAIVLRALGINNDATIAEDAVKAGIFAEGTDFSAKATRGETFVALVSALNAEVAGTGKTLGAVLGLKGYENASAISAQATAAKKITVTFNGPVDTAKAKITVWNGTNQVNSKSITFSDDKKSAVVEFALNLPAAEYTVKVEGLSETALTAAVKVDAQKVTKIEFGSDKAPYARGSQNDVIVGYNVLDQYGDKMNSEVLNVSLGKGSAGNNGQVSGGSFTVNSPAAFILGEKLVVSLVHKDGAYASATLEVSPAAQAASVDITKVYQADNKELVAGSSDTFSLLVDLKDQYGATVTSAAYLNGSNGDLIITVSNPTVATLSGYSNNNATWTASDIDGDGSVNTHLNIIVGSAGTSNVTIISKATGAKDSFDIVVKETVKVDTLTLTAPASAPAGATVEIPFTAVDQFGAAIANPTNAQVNNITVTNGTYQGFVKDHVKNTTSFKVTLGAKGTSIVTVITGTNKVAQISINVTDGAVASVISGIKDTDTAFLVGGTGTIGTGNVVVKDQYGNGIDPSYGTGANQYRVFVETSASSKVSLSSAYADGNSSVTLTGAAKGSSLITLTLEQNVSGTWTKVANSSYVFNAKVVEKADIKSYTATVAGTVYTGGGSSYYKDLTVKGTLEDGSTVTVPNNAANYAVNTAGSGVSYTGSQINASGFSFSGSDTSAETSIIVAVYGATGNDIQPVTVKVSKANPAVATLELVTSGDATKEGDGVISATAANVNNNFTKVVNDAIKAVDQYGIEWKGATEPQYTVYTGNFPTGRTTLSALIPGDSISVTAVTPNGKAISFKLIVK